MKTSLPFLLMTVLSLHAAVSLVQEAYIKASNTDPNDRFGASVALSGNTMVVGAPFESSSATGVNGNQTNNSASQSGAAYVFVRNGTNWVQQAYLKASNTDASDGFGVSVAIDGDTIVVGAWKEDSSASGVNGDQTNNALFNSGAAYVFVREGTNWVQQAYLKASNPGMLFNFGFCVVISSNTIAVSSPNEGSSTGVTGPGAVYVFTREGTNWQQQAYFRASNAEASDQFGYSLAISGETIWVGAIGESSAATGVNGNQTDNSATASGAAYVFVRSGTNWTQQAYLKASNTGAQDRFGGSVAVSGDTVVVRAITEGSNATGVNGDQSNNAAPSAGAAYVFVRNGTNWSQQAYLKSSNMEANDGFGAPSIAGDILLIGAPGEDSSATGIGGDQTNNALADSGAAYLLQRAGTNWIQSAYIKASNTGNNNQFGGVLVMSSDTLVVAAPFEDGSSLGVNGNQNDDAAIQSGAVYVFQLVNPEPRLTISPDGSGGYFLTCEAEQAGTYQLEWTSNLGSLWTTNSILTNAGSGVLQFHDTNAPGTQAFYRVSKQ